LQKNHVPGGEEMAVRVTAGRHELHCVVRGSGAPTVVIEPGFWDDGTSWQPFAERFANTATVLTYNRAAYGPSSRAYDRRTCDDIAADLAVVVDAAGVPQPVVLVGHSFGGIILRAYAARHLDQVAGMVLVDSSVEGQDRRLAGTRGPWMKLQHTFTPARLVLAGRRGRTGADRRTILREWRTLHTWTPPYLLPGGLGDRPLAVLTQAPTSHPAWWKTWHQMHTELARLSSNVVHVVADEPGHYIQRVQPALVESMICSVLEAARTGVGLTSDGTQ
jgi:pimeloyl-ACP methyl ester carboxylesterase